MLDPHTQRMNIADRITDEILDMISHHLTTEGSVLDLKQAIRRYLNQELEVQWNGGYNAASDRSRDAKLKPYARPSPALDRESETTELLVARSTGVGQDAPGV